MNIRLDVSWWAHHVSSAFKEFAIEVNALATISLLSRLYLRFQIPSGTRALAGLEPKTWL